MDDDLKEAWRLIVKGLVFVLILGLFFGGCCWFNAKAGLPNDHILEDHLEDLVEDYLGLPRDSLDFTPGD